MVADTDFVLQFKAVCPNEVKLRNLAVKIKEAIPEPVFSLRAPAAWNGRNAIEVIPEISNLNAMRAKGAGDLKYKWTVSGGAVIKEIAADRLILKRSQCSGTITIKLALNNGGAGLRRQDVDPGDRAAERSLGPKDSRQGRETRRQSVLRPRRQE